MSRGYLDRTEIFDGGYREGLHQRLRRYGLAFALVGVSVVLSDAVWRISQSTWLTLLVAALCGALFLPLWLRFDGALGEPSTRRDKVIWCVVIGPAIILNGAMAFWNASDGGDLFEGGLRAGMFGALVVGTALVFSGSRAKAGS